MKIELPQLPIFKDIQPKKTIESIIKEIKEELEPLTEEDEMKVKTNVKAGTDEQKALGKYKNA